MTNINLEVSNGSTLKRKIKAFEELFGSDPIITVRDDLEDTNGNLYFGKGLDATILRINHEIMVVDMGGEGQGVFKFNEKTKVTLSNQKN